MYIFWFLHTFTFCWFYAECLDSVSPVFWTRCFFLYSKCLKFCGSLKCCMKQRFFPCLWPGADQTGSWVCCSVQGHYRDWSETEERDPLRHGLLHRPGKSTVLWIYTLSDKQGLKLTQVVLLLLFFTTMFLDKKYFSYCAFTFGQ